MLRTCDNSVCSGYGTFDEDSCPGDGYEKDHYHCYGCGELWWEDKAYRCCKCSSYACPNLYHHGFISSTENCEECEDKFLEICENEDIEDDGSLCLSCFLESELSQLCDKCYNVDELTQQYNETLLKERVEAYHNLIHQKVSEDELKKIVFGDQEPSFEVIEAYISQIKENIPLTEYQHISKLINGGKISCYCFREDLIYRASNPSENIILSFIDLNSQVYIAEVWYDPQSEHIFPPK